jgi:hypothetical protein
MVAVTADTDNPLHLLQMVAVVVADLHAVRDVWVAWDVYPSWL